MSAGEKQLDEVALVAGLKAGDDKARVQFWKSYWDVAYPRCARILGNDAETVEIVVDLLTDFMTHSVSRLEEPRALSSYVRLMAVRRALAAAKQRRRQETLQFDPKDESAATPEEMAHWRMLAPHLYDCMDKLTRKSQQALRLKYGQQLNNVEIGNILGGSKQYISRLTLNCLDVLRKCIESSAGKQAQKER